MADSGLSRALAIGLALWSCACGTSAEPRGQVVITVDTDLPLVSQALSDATLSYDAAVDVLRVDVHRLDLGLIEFREHLAPDERDWPLSFGIASDGREQQVLVRLRVFAASLSSPGEVEGEASLEPLPSATVDRLLQITLPESGVERLSVVLSGDCMGRRVRFSPLSTCIDAARLETAPDGGEDAIGTSTRAGTWLFARERECSRAEPAGTRCIPGGFSFLGDESLRGTAEGALFPFDPVPLEPIVVSPFFMDTTEMTVGTVRQLVLEQPDLLPELPIERGPQYPDCTWLGVAQADHDELPLNCVTPASAAVVCAELGGELPSEAQWEHAARGRGRRWRYPWGNDFPECCTLVAGALACGLSEPAPAASQQHFAGCAAADVSRDGVLHLGGNLSEVTRDRLVAYDDGCWAQASGILVDPSCPKPANLNVVARGAAYNESSVRAAAPIRRMQPEAAIRSVGFRCVHPDLQP